MGIYASLAFAQVRHRPGRWLLFALGIALTTLITVGAAGASRVVAAQTARHAIDALPPGDRTVTVTGQRSVFASGHTEAEVNSLVRTQLTRLTSHPIRHQVVYRQISQRGSTFFVAATDELPSAVTLTQGRLPTSCTPARCEVLALTPPDEHDLADAAASLGLVVVGHAVRADTTFMTGSFDPGTTPVLVGGSVDGMTAVSSLDLIDHSYGWVADMDTHRVLSLGMDTYLRRSADVNQQLDIGYVGIGYVRPDSVLASEQRRAELSQRRFELLGGATAAVMLGFALVAAVSLRREHAVLVRVLQMRGGRRLAITVMTSAIAATVAVVAAVVGLASGVLAGWAMARIAELAPHTVLAGVVDSILPVVGLVVAATALATAVLLWADTRAATAWHGIEIAAAVVLAGIALAVSRGGVSADALGHGPDPLLVVLPALSAVAAGLVVARLWPGFVQLLDRVLPGTSFSRSAGLLSAVRRPLRAVATAGFVAAAITLAVFATGYRSTLQQGAFDQAAMAVPLDMTLAPGTALLRPLDVATVTSFDSVAPGATTTSVLRQPATVAKTDGSTGAVVAVGLDPATLTEIHRWHRVTGSGSSPEEVARRFAVTSAQAPALTPGTRQLAIASPGLNPDVQVTLWFAEPDGREYASVAQRRGGVLDVAVPDRAQGRALSVVAVAVSENPLSVAEKQHRLAEGRSAQSDIAGTLSLGAVQADGSLQPWDWTAWSSSVGVLRNRAGTAELDYRLNGSPVVLTPRTPDAVPVIVDPDTASAASNGIVSVRLGTVSLTGRIVAVMQRFPTVGGRFVALDRQTLARFADRSTPGSGQTSELWLSVPSGEIAEATTRLGQAPFDQLKVESRTGIARALARDPVATGSRTLLATVAGMILLVAIVALALFVVGERRDESSEFHAWEADGVRPAALRAVLRVRVGAVALFAVPCGVIAGLVLAEAGSALVAVNAAGTQADPPLRSTIDLPTMLGIVGLATAAGLLVSWLIVSTFLREPWPVRPEVDLR